MTPQSSHATRPQIEIVPHDPGWPSTYEHAKRQILEAIKASGRGHMFLGIQHIGSTSVPGLKAKPRIDIMIGWRSVEDLTAFPGDAIKKLGFSPLPFSKPEIAKHRLLFSKLSPPSVNVHVFAFRRALWRGHLAFRDYLRTHPHAVRRYELIKTIVAKHTTDPATYGRAKSQFVGNLQREALRWRYPTFSLRKAMPIVALDAAANAYTGANAGTSGPVYAGDPYGWVQGVWYSRNPDGTFSVSSSQDPRNDSNAVGVYWCYNGDNNWSVVVRSAVGSSPDPTVDPTQGNAIPPDFLGDGKYYVTTITNSDGSVTTKEHYPADMSATDFRIPTDGTLTENADGTYTLTYPGDQQNTLMSGNGDDYYSCTTYTRTADDGSTSTQTDEHYPPGTDPNDIQVPPGGFKDDGPNGSIIVSYPGGPQNTYQPGSGGDPNSPDDTTDDPADNSSDNEEGGADLGWESWWEANPYNR